VKVHNRCDAFLTTDEFFCLAHPVKIVCGDTTSIGREEVVVTATLARLLSVQQNPMMVVANYLFSSSF
jgi:hypothetical protein